MSEGGDPLDVDAETLMQQKADNIEFVVEESDEENQEAGEESEPEPGDIEDTITIVVESDDDDTEIKSELMTIDENSIESISYIDDYPDLEEVTTDQIDSRSKQISKAKSHGIKRTRVSDDEKAIPSKKSLSHKGKTSEKLVTNPCFVPGCQLPKDKKVYFFRMPRNKILFQLWDILIKRPGARLTSQCLVCQQHFHKDDILWMDGPKEAGGRLLALKKEALPCINYIQRCPVATCGLRTGPSQQFPILNKNNFGVWLERLGNPRLKFLEPLEVLRYRVCNSHFHKECFDKNMELKSGSAPSLNIPDFPEKAYMTYRSVRDLLTIVTPPLIGRCAFDKCAEKARKRQKVYPLPNNCLSLVKWLAASGHPNWINTTLEKTLERVRQQCSADIGVCLDHFTSYDFVDASFKQLSDTAVPTRKGDREEITNYAVEVKNVVPVASLVSTSTVIPTPLAPAENNMVILLPNDDSAGQKPPVSPVQGTGSAAALVLPNVSPQQTKTVAVPATSKPVQRTPPHVPGTPAAMIPLLVSNNGDTKLMLVPPEVIKQNDADSLQKLVMAVSSGRQSQTGVTPSPPKTTFILPKQSFTTPKVTNILPRIPTPKVTPSMRRAAAANLTPTATIDLTETSEKNKKSDKQKADDSDDPASYTRKRGCCYVGCTAEPSAKNPLYNFPVDVERRKVWLRACGRRETLSKKWLQICKIHFTDECFHESGYLLPDAVPKQNKLNASDEQSDSGPQSLLSNSSSSDNKEPPWDKKVPCALLRCSTSYGRDTDKWKMYRFPNPTEEPDRFRAWIELVYNPTLKYEPSVIYDRYVVCDKHFEKVFYKKGDKSLGLCAVAVPTLIVPGKRFLKSLSFYRDKVEPYLKEIENVTVELIETDDVSLEESQNTTCVLEKDKITFPGLGNCLKFTKHDMNKHAYTMYRMTKKMYAAIWDIEEGESINIHTAIIIDDNDECEKAVLQQILDTRRSKETCEQSTECA